ncbi:hypothetical protein GPECTOR_5g308 [Gonium pectorale]|uniref:Uncharacterized protein n=1 Tax=Gonium pectorale TaxID=33097 RepID=A0A150GWE1_GONPE|nr:hypothetical protein GPECTOR_5g308 [Gonium pectorale]|eukprot:KXZ54216.1 hypothetical protein GPECTOR_5g308 [Gonium pectorale]
MNLLPYCSEDEEDEEDEAAMDGGDDWPTVAAAAEARMGLCGRSGGGLLLGDPEAAGGSAGPSGSLYGHRGADRAAAAFAGMPGAWRGAMRPSGEPEAVHADVWSEDEEEEADTTAEQFYAAEHPKDIQGIPWERLQFDRSTYRDTRLRQYRNYTNVLPDDDGGAYRAELAPLCAAPRRGITAGVAPPGASGPPFFAFVRNSRSVQSNIVHFQLRNLVWAVSPNDVYVVHDNCINHWNPTSRMISEVLCLNGSGGNLDFGGGGAGGRAGASSRLMGLGRVQVSTMCVAGDLVAAGGFVGELVVRRLRGEDGQQGRKADAGPGGPVQGKLLHCGRITSSDNGITNGLEIFSHPTHGTVVMAANNDSQLRLFAVAPGEGSLRPLASWPFDWAVNYATVRPGGGASLAAVVGDDPATLLTDVHNGVTVARLQGHRDFSFAAAWHPGGTLLATGNQDTTTLLWDVRRTDEPLTRLAGRMGAIRSLRFSPDGRFLAMSEPADFVHIYDVASGFLHCQEHDFFGEVAGISFTPDSSSLFVGVSDLTYASLMHLERQRCEWQ